MVSPAGARGGGHVTQGSEKILKPGDFTPLSSSLLFVEWGGAHFGVLAAGRMRQDHEFWDSLSYIVRSCGFVL